MNKCTDFETCSFVKHCNDNEVNSSVNQLLDDYCIEGHQEDCIRRKLTDTFNRTVVPSAMMPDGNALPGTSKENWPEEALNYRAAQVH